MIKDGFLYLAALIFAAAVLVNLPKIFKGKKAQVFFNFAPPIVLIYLGLMLLCTMKVWDLSATSAVYKSVKNPILYAMLFIMLLRCDLKKIIKLGPKMLIGFFAATLSIGLGFFVSYAIFHQLLGAGSWKALGALCGSWMGGGGNMLAIQAALDVHTDIMDVEEAKKSGAMALFGEKYDQKVRVVSMGDFSKELCGGTHVANTGNIMLFKIVSESGIAAGVRRIEALTGNGVLEYYKKQEELLHEAAKALKANPAEIVEKIGHLQGEVKALSSENESLKSKLAQGALGDVMDKVVEVKGVKLLAAKVDGVDMNGLRDLGDQLKGKLGEGVVLLAAVNGEKVNLLAMATDAAQKAGAHAGNLIKGVAAIVGGGGGGRPDSAMAGCKNVDKLPDAMAQAAALVRDMIQ